MLVTRRDVNKLLGVFALVCIIVEVDSLKLSNATVPSTPKQKVKQAHQALRVANSNLLSAMSEYNEVDRQHNVSKIALARALRKNRTKPEWDGSRPISSIVNQNSDVPVNTTVDPDAAAEDLEKKKEAVEKSSDELIKANAALKATERPLPSGILDSAASWSTSTDTALIRNAKQALASANSGNLSAIRHRLEELKRMQHVWLIERDGHSTAQKELPEEKSDAAAIGKLVHSIQSLTSNIDNHTIFIRKTVSEYSTAAVAAAAAAAAQRAQNSSNISAFQNASDVLSLHKSAEKIVVEQGIERHIKEWQDSNIQVATAEASLDSLTKKNSNHSQKSSDQKSNQPHANVSGSNSENKPDVSQHLKELQAADYSLARARVSLSELEHKHKERVHLIHAPVVNETMVQSIMPGQQNQNQQSHGDDHAATPQDSVKKRIAELEMADKGVAKATTTLHTLSNKLNSSTEEPSSALGLVTL